MFKNTPFILIISRLLLGPIMILVSLQKMSATGNILATLFIVGILTDVFDGIIARRLKISTEKLRKWDSNVDFVFIVSALISAYLFKSEAIIDKAYFIAIIIILELIMYLISYIKFKKLPANHAYSAKVFAILICVSLSTLFLNFNWDYSFYIMFCMGTISYLDNYLILFLLKEYKIDTKVFWKAKN